MGPNGSGKTTIIDNAHPYRLMPSRASSASVGGFSYYDHLCAPEGGKDLEWMHEGRRFRSPLANAREAKVLQPSADLEIARVRQGIATLVAECEALQRELTGLGDTAAQLVRARASLDTVIEQRRVAQAEAALAEPLHHVQDRLVAISAEAAAIGQRLHAAQASARDERGLCDAAERESAERHAGEVTELDAALARLAQQLAGLPPPLDGSKRAAAELTASRARRALAEADDAHADAMTQHARLGGQLQSAVAHLGEGQTAVTAAAHLETERALWTALAKALGNDGVIALCIDDAGPTLASLAGAGAVLKL